LAKPNFQYEKRQKELEKKRKKEDKLKRKAEKGSGDDQGAGDGTGVDDPAAGGGLLPEGEPAQNGPP
jgi:hypothetical protein